MTLLPPPPETNALSVAAQWIADVLTGPVATSLAVISIAALGYLMLNGRLDLRRGLRIVLGCFILFGAPTIALGLRNATPALARERQQEPQMSTASALTLPSRMANSSADPYAGAAVRR
ncbi:MAG: TrbC/VirB2 family protein [Pseudomonadota bacterium]|nr:TrbC/VirB2 family protein [Pseudomonadota bacterium]MED5537231.1 TrbC/VirB2 family protein [Pseudomonadota bacterium]